MSVRSILATTTLVLGLAVPVAALPAVAAPWYLSPETSIQVDVKYVDSLVKIRFPTLSGAIEFDERHPERAAAKIKVATADLETGLGLINNLAESRQFLDASGHPTIDFTLDRLEQTSKSTADIHGSITLVGVTRPITFKATVFRYGPSQDDPSLIEAGFNLEGAVDRTDFGITAGQPDIANTLPIHIHLLMRSKP